ncbi:hypothetical protein GPJ56_004585 [Histomonas meleagridis]|uniref:uncharacterized protein n=1 Tax=Histomonas meleagridis TaxID=135588 RepID=UPI003559667B|nr:hypothetical protein GPJ56_004585 [Histomonas meleagridis]KAH0800551.1 hypothetical protein GO595_006619 [Histomonas meleagridis]
MLQTREDQQIASLKEIDEMINQKNVELDKAEGELDYLENQLEIKNHQLSIIEDILNNAEEKYALFDTLITKYEEEAKSFPKPPQNKAEVLEEVKSFYRQFEMHEKNIQDLIDDPKDLKDLIKIASDITARYEILRQKALEIGISEDLIPDRKDDWFEEEENLDF